MGVIVLAVGVIGLGAVIGAVVVFTVIRGRNSENGGPLGRSFPQNMGYPPQYPAGRKPYPNADPGHGYTTPPGQSPQHPNPYAQ
jgi:hypothetical protein